MSSFASTYSRPFSCLLFTLSHNYSVCVCEYLCVCERETDRQINRDRKRQKEKQRKKSRETERENRREKGRQMERDYSGNRIEII